MNAFKVAENCKKAEGKILDKIHKQQA